MLGIDIPITEIYVFKGIVSLVIFLPLESPAWAFKLELPRNLIYVRLPLLSIMPQKLTNLLLISRFRTKSWVSRPCSQTNPLFPLLHNPFHKRNHLLLILNHGKRGHRPNLSRTAYILIIFYLFENHIDIDNIIAFALLVLLDDLTLECLICTRIEHLVHNGCQLDTRNQFRSAIDGAAESLEGCL